MTAQAQSGRAGWWTERGFWGNPYDTEPLGRGDKGIELLVGREQARHRLLGHLRASTAHIAIAGPYGSGKTSLVRCLMAELERDARQFASGELLLPVSGTISPHKGEDVRAFVERCLIRLAATLPPWSRQIELAGGHIGRHIRALGRFVEKPLFSSGGAGATILGAGASGSAVRSVNTGFGFRVGGFGELVSEALTEAFPAEASGALVACIDDIEAFGKAEQVQAFLSDVREPLLKLPGVKWIIVGVDEVLDGVDQSPRLAGVIGGVDELPALPGRAVAEVVEKRIELYHLGQTVFVPVNGEAFAKIYETSGRHLRSALNLSQRFAVYADDNGILDGPSLMATELEDGDGPWIRWDVAGDAVDRFYDRESLVAWDELAKLGGVAASVLEDLALAGEMDSDALIDADPIRARAAERLGAKGFVSGSARGVPPDGRLRLTGRGHLAMGGARLASRS